MSEISISVNLFTCCLTSFISFSCWKNKTCNYYSALNKLLYYDLCLIYTKNIK